MIFWSQVNFNKQFGFQVNTSTRHTLLELINNIINSFENSEFTLEVFIDLSEAFDTVNHDIQLKKLGPRMKVGVGGAGVHAPPPPPHFFLRSYFAGDVFLEIYFCVILQGIYPKLFWLGTPRILSGALNDMA